MGLLQSFGDVAGNVKLSLALKGSLHCEVTVRVQGSCVAGDPTVWFLSEGDSSGGYSCGVLDGRVR